MIMDSDFGARIRSAAGVLIFIEGIIQEYHQDLKREFYIKSSLTLFPSPQLLSAPRTKPIIAIGYFSAVIAGFDGTGDFQLYADALDKCDRQF